jgi:omega-amidase
MKLTIALAQIKIAGLRPEDNIIKGESFVAKAKDQGADLICFPEMWTTGLNWHRDERLLPAHRNYRDQASALAAKYRIWLNGSMLNTNELGQATNTSLLFNDQGETVGGYSKTHLFSLLNEAQHLTAGNSLTIIQTPWGKFGLSICYDIRFPELFRAYALQGVELILSPIAFPYPRRDHWRTLVRARAIEEQLFMVGTNRVGSEDLETEGKQTYFGTSCIIDPWGETVTEGSEDKEELLVATIDLDKVKEVRSKMTVFQDRRPELYRGIIS